jgi:hypothetical protein
LLADKKQMVNLQYQYSFEELCAKTLYNMADHSAGFSSAYLPPFDMDAPFWVVPSAIHLAQQIGIQLLPLGEVVIQLKSNKA